MKIKIPIILAALIFLCPYCVHAENHYSQVVARMEQKPGNVVALTRSANKEGAEQSLSTRSAELATIGWKTVNKGLAAGKEYDKKFEAMFADQPFTVSYLSFNDKEGREVRISISELDTMQAASLLNYYKIFYERISMEDIKIIHPAPRPYTSKEVGVTFTLPGSWFANESKWGENPVVQLLIPRNGPQDLFTRNLSILKVYGRKSTVQDYLKALAEFNAKKITGYEVTSEGKKTIKGREFVYLESMGKIEDRALKFFCWYTMEGDFIYNITYTAPLEDPERDKAAVQQVVESLSWT